MRPGRLDHFSLFGIVRPGRLYHFSLFGIMRPGRLDLLQLQDDFWSADVALDLKQRNDIALLKFEPSRLFMCQRTCHLPRGLVAEKSCRVI